MIDEEDKDLIAAFDYWLDDLVEDQYKSQPMAQDWARVAKLSEEVGEAIEALIAYTGQNPRKATRAEARDEMLEELADVCLTAMYAIQHFTKDADKTDKIISDRMILHGTRVGLL